MSTRTSEEGYEIRQSDGSVRHLTDITGDKTIDFLCTHQSDHPGQPFCLSISFNAPHAQDNDPDELDPVLSDGGPCCSAPSARGGRKTQQLPRGQRVISERTRQMFAHVLEQHCTPTRLDSTHVTTMMV